MKSSGQALMAYLYIRLPSTMAFLLLFLRRIGAVPPLWVHSPEIVDLENVVWITGSESETISTATSATKAANPNRHA